MDFKFEGAELLGIPARIGIGSRGLDEGVVELKNRGRGAADRTPQGEVRPRARELMS